MQRKGKLNSTGISRTWIGKTLSGFGVTALIGGTLMLAAPGSAMADDCAALGGVPSPGLCTVNSPVVLAADGSFSLDNDFLITGGGSITTTGFDLTVNANGNITLDPDAKIVADGVGASCPGSNGGNITLNADANHDLIGDVTAALDSKITSNSKCSAGAIVITGTTINIAGDVESISTLSGTGRPGGGPITIDATCDLNVPGEVTSKGNDPGADLVHLEGGCKVNIAGTVNSISPDGHSVPINPPNHCYDPDPAGDLAGDPDPLGASDDDRLDKPNNSAACIEVWAGDLLTITGEVNADLDRSGPGGTSWIDLFARGNIQIPGGAVHANGKGPTNDDGGRITVISTTGDVLATNSALLQADATRPGGDGGTLTVHAFNNVILDTARLSAQGDSNPGGGLGTGGVIAVRAFHAALSWKNGVGLVEPDQTGAITLTYCTSVDLSGTNFGDETPVLVLNCVGDPVLPKNPADSVSYVLLPDCICLQPDAPCVCIDRVNRVGNLLTIEGNQGCSGGFLGNPVGDDEITLVGFSATCESNPTCRAVVNPATRTNTSIQVTVPGCAVPGNFVIVGIDAAFPNPSYKSFSCFKAGLPTP